MIPGILQTIQEDIGVLSDWIKGEDLPDDQKERVQTAALRMIVVIGIAFGGLWTLSLVIFIATISLSAVKRVATAVGGYVLLHDLFTLHQNACDKDFSFTERIKGIGTDREDLEEDEIDDLTKGTFLQPDWKWIYTQCL